MPGPTEWIIIGIVVVLLFGAKKLPEMARALGRSSSEFKKGLQEGSKDDEPDTAEPKAEKKTDNSSE